MTATLTTTLILAAVSGVLQALGIFVRPLARIASILLLVWLAAALPLMFFLNVASQYVLLFYLLSAVLGLILQLGGKPV